MRLCSWPLASRISVLGKAVLGPGFFLSLASSLMSSTPPLLTSILEVSSLELHSNGTKPVTFFGEQSSVGGGTILVWGSTAPECPPWRRAWSVINRLTTSELFNRFACFWPKGYQRGSLRKSHQNGDYLKQAKRKSCRKHAKRLNIKTLACKRQKHHN